MRFLTTRAIFPFSKNVNATSNSGPYLVTRPPMSDVAPLVRAIPAKHGDDAKQFVPSWEGRVAS